MKKHINKFTIKLVSGTFFLGIGCNVICPTISYAENFKKVQNYSYNELIDIVNPYIVETFNSYYIRDEKELLQKIGQTNLEVVKERLVVANKEKSASLQRDANVVRQLANIFYSKASGHAEAASIVGLLSGLVPGYQLSSIVASISSLVMGSDANTWNKVQNLVATEMIYGNYNLTIDINAWNTEVKVY